MELVNETNLDTKALKTFASKALKHKNAKLKRLNVRYSRSESVNGEAKALKALEISIFIPKGFCGTGGCITSLAQILEHEIDHAFYGLDHHNMPDWWTLPVLWASGLTIPLREIANRAVSSTKKKAYRTKRT